MSPDDRKRLEEAAQRLADEAPPITDEQRAMLRALLHAPHGARSEKAAA